jgi:hypothetical protein
MQFENHLINEETRVYLGIPKDGISSPLEDFQIAEDSEQVKAMKDLDFYIRKPFCGCGRCSL